MGVFFFLAFRDKFFGKERNLLYERKEQKGRRDIENRMQHGYVGRYVLRGASWNDNINQLKERMKENQRQESSRDIEADMNRRRPFCVHACPKRGHYGINR